MSEHPLVDALSEDELERLEDGEMIRVAVELREPFLEDFPHSFNELKISLSTRGTTMDLEEPEDLAECFPDVEGLEELIDDGE